MGKGEPPARDLAVSNMTGIVAILDGLGARQRPFTPNIHQHRCGMELPSPPPGVGPVGGPRRVEDVPSVAPAISWGSTAWARRRRHLQWPPSRNTIVSLADTPPTTARSSIAGEAGGASVHRVLGRASPFGSERIGRKCNVRIVNRELPLTCQACSAVQSATPAASRRIGSFEWTSSGLSLSSPHCSLC